VFAETGYTAATVRQICTKAEVNVAAVNYHFGDKLGLYSEVLKRSAGPAAQLMIRAAMLAAPSPEEALRIFVRGLFEKVYGDKPQADIKIMTQEMVNPTPAFDDVVEQVMRPQYEELCVIVGRAVGHPPEGHVTRLCVFSLMGQVVFYFHSREVIARLAPDLKIAKARNQIADHIVAFTIAGLKATNPPTLQKRK
jgi:AcrR family transcriptional regulator